MNLFRSEEHVRNWSGFKADTEEGIVPLLDVAGLFAGDFFTKRLEPDYASRIQDYLTDLIGTLNSLGSFWQMPQE